MADTRDWQKLAGALRELHRTLMERARRDYESEHGEVLNPGQLLGLLTTDPSFDWLRSLSELMVDIDMARDAEPAVMEELATAIRPAIEHILSSPNAKPAGSFAQRYWPYVQDDPHVAMAHAAVKQAIASWPAPDKSDAAKRMSERERLAAASHSRVRARR